MNQRPDPEAFEALVRAHSASAFRAARRILNDDALAYDAVQEVFLAVLEGRFETSAARDVGAVLRARAVHVALAARRGDARRRTREEQHAMILDDTPDASTPAERADDARGLWEQVVRLPEELRLALLLRFREGYSFATIGRELGCAEPTAHDRVRRGLERLRALLTGAGLSALVVDLESCLGTVDSGGPLPEELAARILDAARAPGATAVAATTTGAALSPLLAVGVVLAASVAAFVTPRVLAGPGADSTSGVTAPLRPDVASVAPPAEDDPARPGERSEVRPDSQDPEPAGPDETPAEPSGRVTGRVVDRAGGAVPGATVHLSTVERRGKFALWGGDTRTNVNGRFALDVPAPEAAGRNVHVEIGRLGFMARLAETQHVVAGSETRLGDVVLDLVDLAREGEFTLDVEVRGADGLPLAGALVSLHHQVPAEGVRVDAGTLVDWSWERGWHRLKDDAGRTEAGGVVTLRGARLGGKVLLVKPNDPAWAPAEIELPIESAGAHARVVTLAPGLAVEGRVTDLEGRALAELHLVLVAAAHPNRDWLFPSLEPEGGFRFAGLASGTYELRVDAPGRSSARLALAAGARDVVVRLKPASDPRDVGDHAAEIHGRLVDAETGAPVAYDPPWDVDSFWFPDAPGRDVLRDVLPNHLLMPPVQRAAQMGMPEEIPPTTEFHLTGLRAGPAIVYINRRGYAPAVAGPYALADETIVADVEVALHAPSALRARVLDRSGAPLEGALVFLTGEGPYSNQRVAEIDAEFRASAGRGSVYDPTARRTDARGRVRTEHLPVGHRVVLVAIHPGHEPVRSAPFTLGGADAEDELELRFRASR